MKVRYNGDVRGTAGPLARGVSRRSLAGLAAVGVLTAACGQSAAPAGSGEIRGQPAEPVEMEFLHFFEGSIMDGFKVINERFEATHPHIKWRGLLTPYSEMHTKIVALVSAGTPPDGMSLPSSRAFELIGQKLIKDLEAYLAKDRQLPLTDVYPARLENYRLGGKLYALPVDNGTGAIFYNKELFDQAGVPYPTDSWTWDDLLAKARQLTRREGPNGPIYGIQLPTSLHNLYAPFAGLGGEYFDKDVTKTTLDAGASIRALQWLIDLRCKEGVAPTTAQANELRGATGTGPIFGHGRYAMEYAWYGLIRNLHTAQASIGDRWDVAPIPQPINGGKRYNVVGGQGLPSSRGRASRTPPGPTPGF